MSTLPQLQRYIHEDGALFPDDRGEYVKYSDVISRLQEVDKAIDGAMDALESDADLAQRRSAFEAFQDLYEPGKLMSLVPPPEDAP